MNATRTHLGQHLLQARRQAGLTQQRLASLCAIEQATLSRIELGRSLPGFEQLLRLARVLGVSLQWFLTGANVPGGDPEDLAIELRALGLSDLLVPTARVPGAFRPAEQVFALAVAGIRPEPRIIEALPALLAWTPWRPSLVRAYSRLTDARALTRLAWLGDVALAIHGHQGFPGGCPAQRSLNALVRAVRKLPAPALDDLGWPAASERVPPVTRSWNINYPASLKTFRERAQHLRSLVAGVGAPRRRKHE